jgi:hypothetical protein
MKYSKLVFSLSASGRILIDTTVKKSTFFVFPTWNYVSLGGSCFGCLVQLYLVRIKLVPECPI